MKHLFVSSLFAIGLAACLATPVETPAPDDTIQVVDRTTSDRGSEFAADDVFYCVQAWETDNVCVEISVQFPQASFKCREECARLGYPNPACMRTAYLDACN